MTFSFANEHERARTLAFARLVGHLISDGSISVMGQGRMNVGQALDREAALDDIELLTGKRPVGTRYDERKWAHRPAAGADHGDRRAAGRAASAGASTSRRHCRSSCCSRMPGRRGARVPRRPLRCGRTRAGPAPARRQRSDGAMLAPPAYSQSAKPEHVEALKGGHAGRSSACWFDAASRRAARGRLYLSHAAFVIDLSGRARRRRRASKSASLCPKGCRSWSVWASATASDKSLRASAAAVYWRTIDTINRQRLWMADRMEALHQDSAASAFNRLAAWRPRS